jgi:hypothetical protein
MLSSIADKPSCVQMKSFIIFLSMDENFHSLLLVDGRKKRGKIFTLCERDTGRANFTLAFTPLTPLLVVSAK